jgi:hypothetical protein
MRDFIRIVQESLEQGNQLNAALSALAEYMVHGHDCDFHAVEAVLKKFGYTEPTHQTRFYRALFHEPLEHDLSKTVGEYADELSQTMKQWFDWDRVQAFARTPDAALNFIHSTYHVMWDRAEWPTQTAAKPLSQHGTHSVVIIWEFQVAPAQIVLSTQGLLPFMKLVKGTPGASMGWEALDDALHDLHMHRKAEDEVLIDTSSNCQMIGYRIYNSDEDAPLD